MLLAVTIAAAACVVVAGSIAMRYLPKPEKTRSLPGNLNVMMDVDGFTAADKRNMKTVIIRWCDIQRITVITTDKGPVDDNLFYHVVHAHGEVSLPAQATGMDAFITKIAALPGFSSRALEAAIQSKSNNSFSVVFTKDQ